MSNLTVYERAMALYGREAQLRMLQEECAELIAAVNHYERGRLSKEVLALEVADVAIMLEQAKTLFSEGLVDRAIQVKTKRLEERMNDGLSIL